MSSFPSSKVGWTLLQKLLQSAAAAAARERRAFFVPIIQMMSHMSVAHRLNAKQFCFL